jgi:hypothetical protein
MAIQGKDGSLLEAGKFGNGVICQMTPLPEILGI